MILCIFSTKNRLSIVRVHESGNWLYNVTVLEGCLILPYKVNTHF